MAHYNNYENKYRKYAHSHNLAMRPKRQVLKNKDYLTVKEKRENFKKWVTFFRRNIHIFIDWYLGVKLYPFQELSLYLMHIHPSFMIIASRGSSKSFMIALYCIAVAILYPGSLIVIGAGTKKQANLIISEKIKKELYRKHPNIAREILDIKDSANEGEVFFHNGSSITVVPASDNARGYRSTLNIYEEFRLIDKNIIDSVFAPFLFSRQAPFLMKKEYEHLIEEPKAIYISSAWYKNGHYMWERIQNNADQMINCFDEHELGILAFDYLLTIRHKLKTARTIEKERSEIDEITFMLEYENIMYGENANAFFKYEMFKRNQKIKKAFYPMRNLDFIENKRNPYRIKRQEGEVRIVSVDVNAVSGEANDNSVITCARLLPVGKGYERQVCYVESCRGGTHTAQALRIKQIYNDFNADYIVLDLLNVGIFLYDELGKITFDEERNTEYPSYIYCKYCEDNDDLAKRTSNASGLPIIFGIKASAQTNSDIALNMRDVLQRNKIKFLIDQNEAERFLNRTNKEYKQSQSPELHNWFEMPYMETALMINETVNLEYQIIDGKVKVSKKSTVRKDRYSSLSYMNYFASILEKELDTQGSDYDFVFTYS